VARRRVGPGGINFVRLSGSASPSNPHCSALAASACHPGFVRHKIAKPGTAGEDRQGQATPSRHQAAADGRRFAQIPGLLLQRAPRTHGLWEEDPDLYGGLPRSARRRPRPVKDDGYTSTNHAKTRMGTRRQLQGRRSGVDDTARCANGARVTEVRARGPVPDSNVIQIAHPASGSWQKKNPSFYVQNRRRREDGSTPNGELIIAGQRIIVEAAERQHWRVSRRGPATQQRRLNPTDTPEDEGPSRNHSEDATVMGRRACRTANLTVRGTRRATRGPASAS